MTRAALFSRIVPVPASPPGRAVCLRVIRRAEPPVASYAGSGLVAHPPDSGADRANAGAEGAASNGDADP